MPHHLGIVMEYVEGGDLATYVHQNRRLGVRQPIKYKDETLSCINY